MLDIKAAELAEGPILLVSSALDRFNGGPDAKCPVLLGLPKTNLWPPLRRPVSKAASLIRTSSSDLVQSRWSRCAAMVRATKVCIRLSNGTLCDREAFSKHRSLSVKDYHSKPPSLSKSFGNLPLGAASRANKNSSC